jgi:hypothetical protein
LTRIVDQGCHAAVFRPSRSLRRDNSSNQARSGRSTGAAQPLAIDAGARD